MNSLAGLTEYLRRSVAHALVRPGRPGRPPQAES